MARQDGSGERQAPVGLTRLRQHFVDPVRAQARETGGAGVFALLAAFLGGDDEAPPSDSGLGPSRTVRRLRLAALAGFALLVVFFLGAALLR